MNIVMASVVLTPTFASTRPACALSFGSMRAVMYAVLPMSGFPLISSRHQCIANVIHCNVRLALGKSKPAPRRQTPRFPHGEKHGRHIVRSGRSTQPDEKSGPPGQGIPGRAYQIDAGWMGGASIDRSRRG